MKKLVVIIPLLIFCLSIQSCEENDIPVDSIGSLKRTTWKVISTSGGIHGGGYTPNFNKIKIDSELNFEILNINNIITKGYIKELEHEYSEHFIEIITEEINTDEYVILDGKHYVEFEGNELRLNFYALDGFNTVFKRVK